MNIRGLAFRYSIFFLGGFIFVFSLAFYYLFNYSMKLLLEEGRQDASRMSELVLSNVESSLSQVEQIPHTIELLLYDRVELSEIERIFSRLLDENPHTFGGSIALEPDIYLSRPGLYAPYFYETEGTMHRTSLATASYDYLNREWYSQAKSTGKPVWSEPYYDTGGGNTLMCTYSVPLFMTLKGVESFLGVVTVDISLNTLTDMVTRAAIYKSGHGFMISRKGTIIAYPDTNLINKNLLDVVVQRRGEEAAVVIRKMMNGESGFAKIGPLREEDEPSWMHYAPLTRTGWSLGLIFPRRALFASIFSLGSGVFLIFIISVVLVLIITILLTNRFTSPIRQLLKAVQRLGQGDFSTPLPVYRSQDEIAHLANAFSIMKEELVQYIRNLQETTSAKEKIESELQVARNIQMGLLPTRFPDRDDIDLYATLIPAKGVGGDLYDFFFPDRDHLFFAVGDVSGKGVPASLFMTLTRTLFRSLISLEKPLHDSMEKVNEELCRENPNNVFVTFITGMLDLSTGTLNLCNAGHTPLFLLRSGGDVEMPALHPNLPLGAMEGTVYQEDRIQVYPGDQLVLYTDGITEASDPDGNFYGGNRLRELLRGDRMLCSEPLAGKIIEDIQSFVAGAEPFDDIALLVISLNSCRKPLQETYPAHEIRLTNKVDDLQRIVREVDVLSREWGLAGKIRMEINLVLEELFTNSVFYAFDDKRRHEIRIRFHRTTEGLEIIYKDDGRPFNPLEEQPADTGGDVEARKVGGLGIHLVKELSDAIDYKREEKYNIITLKKFIRENY